MNIVSREFGGEHFERIPSGRATELQIFQRGIMYSRKTN